MNNIIETAEIKKGSSGRFDFLERECTVVEVRWTTYATRKRNNIAKGKKISKPHVPDEESPQLGSHAGQKAIVSIKLV